VFTAADAEQTRGVLFWLLGSLASASWRDVAVVTALVAAGLVACLVWASSLDSFTFGEDAAAGLGVRVGPTRLGLLLVTASMTAVDRKSTRLNSSHVKISYAVFCLK